jgi:anti-sigma B factor antagonist
MSHFVLEREGAKVRVHLGTELTVSFVPELRELLCAILDDGVKDLVLECAQTSFLDTAGLSLLLAARRSFSQDGRTLKLSSVQPSVRALLETLRLDKRLNANVE